MSQSHEVESRGTAKMKKKIVRKGQIVSMIMNASKEYPTGEEDVSRDNETKGILKIIDRERLTK